ncbi:hypothetical protein JK182_01325 [Acetobacter okinawensis]|uniref:hypothetical protein n=1 Tax=Acetobacter okinawensis TaxID=1076594 RepID=UPI001BA7B789|nr:hypothetical protein [Acetobacter okinawensis]MBS0987333.1 hypothetical protein [Acetobacter okinawensis]
MNTNTYEENKELKNQILDIADNFPRYSQLWLITRLDNEVNQKGKLPEPELLDRLKNCLRNLNENDEVTKKIDMLSFNDMTRILNIWEEKVQRYIEEQPITNINKGDMINFIEKKPNDGSISENKDFNYKIVKSNNQMVAEIDKNNLKTFTSFYNLNEYLPDNMNFMIKNGCDFKGYAFLDKDYKKDYAVMSFDNKETVYFTVLKNKYNVPEYIENMDNSKVMDTLLPDRKTEYIDAEQFKQIINNNELEIRKQIEKQPITDFLLKYPDASCDIIELNDEIKLARIDMDNVEKFCSFYGLEEYCPEDLGSYYEGFARLEMYALLDKENVKKSVISELNNDVFHNGVIHYEVIPNLFDVPDNIKNYDVDSLIMSINPDKQIYSLKEDKVIISPENKTGFDFFELQKINKILEGDNQIEKFKAIKNENSDFTYEVKELDNGLKTVTLDDKSTKLYNLIANGIEIPEEDKDINDKTWNPEKHLFFIINDKNEALATMETSWYGIDTEIDSVVRHSDKDKENVDRTLFNHLADLSDEGYIRNLRNMINENDVCQFDTSLNFYQVLAEGHMDEKEREQERKEEEESHAIRM